MKVLFVGEGPQDVGSRGIGATPQKAAGVIPILVRKICPGSIDGDSISIFWREPPKSRLSGRPKRGYAAMARSALVIAVRANCDGVIFVADSDDHPERLGEIEEGVHSATLTVPKHVVVGLAVQSIEAWTLGAITALASVLHIPSDQLPYKPKHVEEFKARSGKAEKQSKAVLESLARTHGHESAKVEFRERAAEATEVAELERRCSDGFAPFAERVRKQFCPAAAGEASP